MLQLIGVALGLALVVFVLIRYAQYVRSRRFIFEGFSNTSQLIDIEKMPLELGMLAREKLVNEFKDIYSVLEKLSGNANPDTDALLTDELGDVIGKYVSTEFFKGDGYVEVDLDLKEVIEFLRLAEGIDLKDLAQEIASREANNVMDTAGEIAPKEVTPILKFIEAVVPPHIVRATGYLQWSRHNPGKAGITFELIDLGSQRNLMVRTIWWQSPEKRAVFAEVQPSFGLNMADEVTANEAQTRQKQTTLPGDDEIALATDRYIDLLRPAMRWLALMIWEQRITSHVPLINRVFKDRDDRFQAHALFLIGKMYDACANQFQSFNSFFYQLAIEHYHQASTTDPNWGLPYLYLANQYSIKAQETVGEMREKLLNEALSLYDKALDRAMTRGEIYSQVRIIITKALAELVSGVQTEDVGRIDRAMQEVDGLKSQIDPADFDPARPDCAAFLYNLAKWYELAYDSYVSIPNIKPRDEARRYIAYSLVRSPRYWDRVENDVKFKSMREEGDLEKLKQELGKKLDKEPEFVMKTGENFKTEIGNILKKVDQLLGRPDR